MNQNRPRASSEPVEPSQPRAPKRIVDDAPLIPDRSADDSDTGWGDGSDSNDERLRRDVPPHW